MVSPILRLSLVILAALAYGAGRVEIAHAQSSDTFVVAVLPFESADDGKSKDLQEKMIEELTALGTYTLVAARDVNQDVQAAGLRPGAEITDAKSLEIAREAGAKIVARGTLLNRGGTWAASATFVDVATRTVQDLPEVTGRSVDDVATKLVEVFNNRNQANKHVIFGVDYMRAENWDRAITNFEQALQYDPELAAAHYYMGQAYLKKGDPTRALSELEKAIEIDPAYINAYHTIGLAYLERGDSTAARNFFEQLVQQKAQDCDVQVAYGYVMANELGEVEKGLAAFERAKQLCPDNPLAYQYLAFALPMDQGDEKIANFQRYLELTEGQATDPEALQYLFGLYFAEERYQEAKTTIDRVLAADPENAQLQMYAGVVASKLNQHQQAIQYYTKAVELNPELQDAYLYRALSYRETGNTTAFAADLEKAGRGRSGEILAGMALRDAHQLIRAGRASAALEALSRAAALGGDRCAIAYYRGDAYYQMGRGAQGEDKSVASNQRSIELFRTAIGHLQGACGTYSSYAGGLISNANQYIERGDLIVKKLTRSGR
jgi:tetratricopeptide (TPR) repeat protein